MRVVRSLHQGLRHGLEPWQFTKDVRLQMAIEGRLPAYIETLLNNLSETGNPYVAKELDGELEKEIASLPASADTLLFLGTDTRYKVPQAGVNAIRLLKKAGYPLRSYWKSRTADTRWIRWWARPRTPGKP